MGLYRFFLSICVLYSHVFGAVYGWNIGVSSVISFFIISGYVNTILIYKYYGKLKGIPYFYLDRVMRIFPQYLFYLIATIFAIFAFDLENLFWQDVAASKILLNAMILPTGYYMFGLSDALYIPSAWSLGLELTFYLFFPLFIHLSDRLKYVIFGLSVSVFICAAFGLINTDWFGYRLIPGTFFIFIIGFVLAKPSSLDPKFIKINIAVALFVSLVVLGTPEFYSLPYNKDVIFGIAIGTLFVAFLKSRKMSKFDDLMGNLSYGVFLNHWLIMVAFEKFSIPAIAVPIASIIIALASYYFIEKPIVYWRRSIRKSKQEIF